MVRTEPVDQRNLWTNGTCGRVSGSRRTAGRCTPTRDGVLDDAVLQVLTHPLFAAFPRQANELRVGTVRSGMADIQRTGWDAGDPAAAAAAECVAGGLEGLALLVGDPVQLAAQFALTWNTHTHTAEGSLPAGLTWGERRRSGQVRGLGGRLQSERLQVPGSAIYHTQTAAQK